jgi:hypothetical protein
MLKTTRGAARAAFVLLTNNATAQGTAAEQLAVRRGPT